MHKIFEKYIIRKAAEIEKAKTEVKQNHVVPITILKHQKKLQ